MPQPNDDPPPHEFDLTQREPADWRLLPIIAGVIVIVFFVLIPWLLLQLRN